MNSCKIAVFSVAGKPHMLDKENRINSFGDSFKLPHLIPDLVNAYFYHTGDGDAVECAFCLINLCKWTPTDIPEEEHKLYSPKCLLSKLAMVSDYPARCKHFECVVCFSNERKIMCVPCCHVVLCKRCILFLTSPKCPLCRDHITYIVPTFM